jgi:hypothetical protein
MRVIEAAGIALAPVPRGATARRIVVPGSIVPYADRIVGVELHQARLVILEASAGIGSTGGFFRPWRGSGSNYGQPLRQSRQDPRNRNTNHQSNRQNA